MNTQSISITILLIFLIAGSAIGQSKPPASVYNSGPGVETPLEKNNVFNSGPGVGTPYELAWTQEVYQWDQAAAKAMAEDKFALAEADAKKSLAISYGSGIGQEILAASLFDQGRNQEALQAYKVMMDMGWNPANVALPYALLLLKSGNYADALAAYNSTDINDGKLLKDNSKFSSTVPQVNGLLAAIDIGLGQTYIDGDDYGGVVRKDKALNYYQDALNLEPDNPVVNYYYGAALKDQGLLATKSQQAQAIALLNKAIKLGNSDIQKASKEALRL